MIDMKIQDVMNNPLLKIGFSSKLFSDHLIPFVENVNKVGAANKAEIIGYLLKEACSYCGISLTYRTIFYDLAWAVLEKSPEYWDEEEKENGFSDIGSHWDFYPEYKGEFDDYDVGTLEYGEYFVGCMGILEWKPARPDYFCYGMFIFFDFWKFQYNPEEEKRFAEVLTEEEENRNQND
jgi:hypothetical protein